METLNTSHERQDLFSDGFLSREEEFVGEGEVNMIKTSATQTGMALNRLITDKDLFDTLFEMLENDECGRVQVSKLIELTKDIMNGDFIELEMILDPMGCDMFVDLETFRTAVSEWEEKQKNSDQFYPQTSTPLNSSQHLSYKYNDSFDVDALNNSVQFYKSFGKEDKMDPTLLETENSQLKFQSSKLAKEVEVMENQLSTLEEINCGLKNEVDSFRFKLQSCECKRSQLQNEVDSLLIRSQEDSERWFEEKTLLQNEKNDLDRQLKSVKDELDDTLKELAAVRSSEHNFQETSREQKTLICELETKKEQLEDLLAVKLAECESFREQCLEVLRNNERLRMTKQDLNEEISKLLEQHYLNQKPPVEWMINDDSDLSCDTNLDVTLDNTNIASTPLYFPRHGSSILSEIMDQTFDDSPSQPICGKSPAFDKNMTIAWSSLEEIAFMLERIQTELDEVTAADLIDRYSLSNGNDDKTERAISPKKRESDFETGGIDIISKLEKEFNTSDASPTSLSPGKLRDQINSQLRILRLQIAKSQSILTHLQSKSLPHVAKSTLNSPVGNEPDLSFSQFSLHNQTRIISRTCAASDSQDSTPIHHRIRTRSCPILPSETTFITKGTQTEPIDSSFNMSTRLESTVKTTTSATPVISITSDLEYDMENAHLITRARTSSYSEAIKLGYRNSDDGLTNENGDDTRQQQQQQSSQLRHLSVLPEEEHEDSDHTLSPKIQSHPRPPPPYRPPPPPRPYHSVEYLHHSYHVQNPSKSLETLTQTQSLPQPDAQHRLRPILPIIRQSSDPFPAHGQPQPFPSFPGPLMPSVYHSLSAQGLDGSDSWFGYEGSGYVGYLCPRPPQRFTPSPVVNPCASVEMGDVPGGGDDRTMSQETILVQADHGQTIPNVNTTTMDETDDDPNKKSQLNRFGSRRRRRSIGSTSNNNPSIQRVKAIDVEEEIDQVSVSCVVTPVILLPALTLARFATLSEFLSRCPTFPRLKTKAGFMSARNLYAFRRGWCDYKTVVSSSENTDDSDVDVKSDILQGMNQANRRARSPSASSAAEITVSSSAKSLVSVETCEVKTFRRKSSESQKNRLLMPELMENSETESAKNSGGSMESETEQPGVTIGGVDVLTPPPPCGDGPFPSLPDSFLKALQLHKSCEKSDKLNEKDVEAKFHSLLLAFKTDTFTLSSRLELHHRQRDIAEKNIDEEIVALKENLNTLNQLCSDEDAREIIKRLHHHLEVLHQSTARMSSRAEVYGAVQQEDRTNRAIEVMLIHVENLKRIQEKATSDLEDIKRVMIENNLLTEDGSENEDTRRNLRSYSMTSSSVGRQASKRRASIAALPRSASEKLDGRTKFINFVNTSRNSVCSIGSRQCSLFYNVKQSPSDNVSPTEKVFKRQAADDTLIPSSSSVELSDDELAGRQRRSVTKKESITSKNNNNFQHNIMSTQDSQTPTTNDLNVVKERMDAGTAQTDRDSHSMHCMSTWSPSVTSEYLTEPSEDDDVTDAPLFHSATKRTINMVDTASNLLALTTWVDNDHLFHGVRYTIGGLLFMAAFLSLLVAFFPGSTSAMVTCHPTHSWKSLEEMFGNVLGPHLQYHHQGRPPV